ncbi:MAG: hypothetical protein ACOCXA_02580 [Planctomycetota bacterium]
MDYHQMSWEDLMQMLRSLLPKAREMYGDPDDPTVWHRFVDDLADRCESLGLIGMASWIDPTQSMEIPGEQLFPDRPAMDEGTLRIEMEKFDLPPEEQSGETLAYLGS